MLSKHSIKTTSLILAASVGGPLSSFLSCAPQWGLAQGYASGWWKNQWRTPRQSLPLKEGKALGLVQGSCYNPKTGSKSLSLSESQKGLQAKFSMSTSHWGCVITQAGSGEADPSNDQWQPWNGSHINNANSIVRECLSHLCRKHGDAYQEQPWVCAVLSSCESSHVYSHLTVASSKRMKARE